MSSIKPPFSYKLVNKDKIILIEKDRKTNEEKIGEGDQMVSEILDKFFSSVSTNLDLPQYINLLINTENIDDPVFRARMKHITHKSKKHIRDRFPNNRFSFIKLTDKI